MTVSGKIIIKLAFSVLFFVILFSFVKGNELVEVLKGIHWGYFILSVAVAPAVLVVSCLKWRLILVHGDKKAPFGRLLRIYSIGYFFSNILPSTVGGDVVRSFYGGNEIDDQVYAAISVFIERFSGILFLLLLVVLMPLLQPGLYREPPILIAAVGGVVGLSLVALLVMVPSITVQLVMLGNWLTELAIRTLERLKITRITGLAERFENLVKFVAVKAEKVSYRLDKAWRTMSTDKVFLVKLFLFTLVFYLLAIFNVFLSFKAFGVEVDLLLVCILVPAAMFFAHLPVTILGNLGYFESIFVVFFLIAGVPPAESLVMGLLLRLKMFMLGIVGMIFYFTFAGGSRKKPDGLSNVIKSAVGS